MRDEQRIQFFDLLYGAVQAARIPVSITFVKEQEERKVRMVEYNDTIWVPQEYGTDMVENLDWMDQL